MQDGNVNKMRLQTLIYKALSRPYNADSVIPNDTLNETAKP